jgi:hypothetical protein
MRIEICLDTYNSPQTHGGGAMTIQIESVEFGDWLIAEISETTNWSKASDAGAAVAASLRLGNLNDAKMVLLEFLTLQQNMLNAASAKLRCD